jgi:glycosyltransferase involved in cell wall biosynthesis
VKCPCAKKNTLILQSAMPDYRQAFLKALIKEEKGDVCVLSGREHFAESLPAGISLGENSCFVDNYYLLKRRVLLQIGVTFAAINSNVVILELNPRIVNTWVILLCRKILGRKSILWGHAWSRAGKYSKTEKIRNAQRRLADLIVVYTKSQENELKTYMNIDSVVAAPNAIYSIQDMNVQFDEANYHKNSFVCIGRLVKEKKIDLLLDAFAKMIHRGLDGVTLVVIGRGPELESLKEKCSELNIQDLVKFEGHITDMNILKEYYSNAYASIAAGSLGLSIIQSMTFGVPMVISKTEPHGPEIEAAITGENCVFFDTNDSDDLADKMYEVVENAQMWKSKRSSMNKYCRDNYSVEAMVGGFQKAIRCLST